MELNATVHYVSKTNRSLTVVKNAPNTLFVAVHDCSGDSPKPLPDGGDGLIVLGHKAFNAQVMAVCYRLYKCEAGRVTFTEAELVEVLTLLLRFT